MLTLWERTLCSDIPVRSDSLIFAASGQEPLPRTLGERNARLLVLHAQVFGRDLALMSRCPACGAVAEFTADSQTLAAAYSSVDPRAHATHLVQISGYCLEFRLPNSEDLASLFATSDDEFAEALMGRCLLHCARDGQPVSADELPATVLDELTRRMESLDPAASISFEIGCPQCQARWDSRLDVGEALWQKIQAIAERILLDVDALARAYGWTEDEVLRLSPTRRAAYLQLATA